MSTNFMLALCAPVAVSLALFGIGEALRVDDDPEITAEIAVEAALDQFRATDTKACENCRGTGKVGDTRVEYECPVCGGDGVK